MIEASQIQYVVTAQRDLLNAKLVGQHVVFSSHAADGIRQNQTESYGARKQPGASLITGTANHGEPYPARSHRYDIYTGGPLA